MSAQDPVEALDENAMLLRRLDGWQEGDHDTGPLIRWASAHLRGCIGLRLVGPDAVVVTVEDVARRAWNMTYGETFPWESMSRWWHDTYTDKARRLLGQEGE